MSNLLKNLGFNPFSKSLSASDEQFQNIDKAKIRPTPSRALKNLSIAAI